MMDRPKHMQALWLKNGRLSCRKDIPLPEVRDGEALVKVRKAGICGTDLQLCKGYRSFEGIPGHEFVGQIAAAPGAPDRIGQRVVGDINVACNACASCLAGAFRHCRSRRVLGIKGLDGAFAEYLRLPLVNLFNLPDSISDAAAVFIEPLAAALRIQEQVAVRSEQRVLVVGAGRLGQLVARTLKLTGCHLAVAARYDRQKKLLQTHGIKWVETQKIGRRAYDIVVEASGTAAGFFSALAAVVPQGRVVLKSTYNTHLKLDPTALVVDEIRLIGSRCGPFDPAIALLDRKQLDPQDLIAACYPLENGPDAFRHASRPGGLKILLAMG